MAISIKVWLEHLVPAAPKVSFREQLRSSLGACIGILVTGSMGLFVAHHFGQSQLWLIAPLGASTVLVFAASASPLAQPWAVVGGNTLSALTALAVISILPSSPWTAGLAVALAIAVMYLARCLHPPGGATALLVVLTQTHTFDFVWLAVFFDSTILVLVGMLYNSLTGKPYPHRPAHAPRNETTLKQDLQTALREHDEFVDISLEDLQVLFEDVIRLRKKSSKGR